MHGILTAFVLVIALLSALPLTSQSPEGKSKVVPPMSADQIRAIKEPRESAQKELSGGNAQMWPPDIATPLSDPYASISIVSVTDVKPPEGPGSPYMRVELHAEQMLRGDSKQTVLQAKSRWMPPCRTKMEAFSSKVGIG